MKIQFDNRIIGEGAFSQLYKSYDNIAKKTIAIKYEKEPEYRSILVYEHAILKNIQHLPTVPRVYDIDFDEINDKFGFKVELLGIALDKFKRLHGSLPLEKAIDISIQILDSIELLHDAGYIHQDIKPANFVFGQFEKKNVLYMVDFGLAKLHLDCGGNPYALQNQEDFTGTMPYASLNSHYRKDLSRRDDLWSHFYTVLTLFGINLPWKIFYKNEDVVIHLKELAFYDPYNFLLPSTCAFKKQLFEIQSYLSSLSYDSKPEYAFIRQKLIEIKYSGNIPNDKLLQALKNQHYKMEYDEICLNSKLQNSLLSKTKKEMTNEVSEDNGKGKLLGKKKLRGNSTTNEKIMDGIVQSDFKTDHFQTFYLEQVKQQLIEWFLQTLLISRSCMYQSVAYSNRQVFNVNKEFNVNNDNMKNKDNFFDKEELVNLKL